MILREIKNQFGDNIVTEQIFPDPAGLGWIREWVDCSGSQDLGLGTCRCISHSTYKSEKLTTEEVKGIIAQKIISLTDKERQILSSPLSWEDKIWEHFWVNGELTQKDVVKWIDLSYRIGQNPLPTLRRNMEAAGVGCDVIYAIDPPGFRPAFESARKTIIVWVNDGGKVDLEFYTPENSR